MRCSKQYRCFRRCSLWRRFERRCLFLVFAVKLSQLWQSCAYQRLLWKLMITKIKIPSWIDKRFYWERELTAWFAHTSWLAISLRLPQIVLEVFWLVSDVQPWASAPRCLVSCSDWATQLADLRPTPNPQTPSTRQPQLLQLVWSSCSPDWLSRRRSLAGYCFKQNKTEYCELLWERSLTAAYVAARRERVFFLFFPRTTAAGFTIVLFFGGRPLRFFNGISFGVSPASLLPRFLPLNNVCELVK